MRRGNPDQIAAIIRNMPGKLKAEMRKAEVDNARGAKEAAETFSQGGYSLAQLARMGHPYSKRRPNPPMNAGIINRQTGRFARSWRTKAGTFTGDGFKSSIRNVSPEAKYMRGTKRMIARPIGKLVMAYIRPRRLARCKRAIQRALRS